MFRVARTRKEARLGPCFVDVIKTRADAVPTMLYCFSFWCRKEMRRYFAEADGKRSHRPSMTHWRSMR